MSFEDRQDFARQVADLNNYGQALNQCETIDEVVSLTLEAVSLLFELTDVTVYEVRNGELRVRESTSARPDDEVPSDVAERALETEETVSANRGEGDGGMASLAVPEGVVDDVVIVIEVRATGVESFGDEYVRPLEILAAHAATAVSNIRSRERLERARQDLATRKEMVEMYDRLLRHDIGNDLQVIVGFADALTDQVDGGQTATYAEKVARAARNSADLINRVGDLVSTLEEEREPEPRDLRDVLTATVEDVDSQYESLAVEYDPGDFEYSVFAGDLLDSVFANVLSNAAVHNEGDVTVEVYAEEPTPDAVVVGMADDGTGIPSEVRDELFEMGRKGPDSEGTGFGLGFVRALTESYGGTVDVRESEASGADFRVTLERA
ncbi:MAG: ATP-binding protein [Haloarculaceae archaeon]